jgi:hypothetical protein
LTAKEPYDRYSPGKKERIKSIKKLLGRWILKQGTAEKAALLLSKDPHLKLSKLKGG